MCSRLQERRLNPRRICRGQVAVQRLSSGRRTMGELLDLSRGGVRLTLEHGLARDEYVKLFFPSKSEKTRPEGRMIIGHVSSRSVRPTAISCGSPSAGMPPWPIRLDQFARMRNLQCFSDPGRPGSAALC